MKNAVICSTFYLIGLSTELSSQLLEKTSCCRTKTGNSVAPLNSDVVVPAVLHEVLSSTTFPHCNFYKHQPWYGQGHTGGGCCSCLDFCWL
ncbi:hypothetical protein AV530_001001 [Patagioenas fasciata monilis]|uniref:Uncharacterized protein n=1 Tax=Patagioenas fasciata monilis TaxID=372326 RepID=A0A1V4KUI4_PATFA|nr:hypothetical protein AV530_001001 [Patagioenas fasciata monilis]